MTSTWVYGYDQDGRLDAVTENGNLVASYGYDQNGNRVSVNAAGVPPVFRTDVRFRIA